MTSTFLICQTEAKAEEKDLNSRRHGGSEPGKSPNKRRDFDGTLLKLRKHYFAVFGVGGMPHNNTDFSRRFGIPRRVFDRLYSALSVRPEFIGKVVAVRKSGIYPLQRIFGALRVLS